MTDDHNRMLYRSARPGRTAVLMLASAQDWRARPLASSGR
jgi:hypothetical protein